MIYNITDIAYEQISGDYYWAKYGKLKVIMDIKTGYINATKLCSLATTNDGTKKQFGMWKQNIESHDLMKALSTYCGIPQDTLLKNPNVTNQLRGTYAHPKLIPHIASWASTEFGIMVSDIVNNQLVREYKETIRAKDTKIDELQRTLDAIQKQNNEILSKNEEQSQQVRELLTATREAKEETYQVQEQLEELNTVNIAIATKLDISTEQRVPKHPDERFNEVFVVCHNPSTRIYKTICRQKLTIDKGIRECKSKGFTCTIYYCDSPNALNLYKRVRSTLPLNYGTVSRYDITLFPGKTTQDLIEHIKLTEREKKNV